MKLRFQVGLNDARDGSRLMNELLLLTCSHHMFRDQECCQTGGQVSKAWQVGKWLKVKHDERADWCGEHLSTGERAGKS